MNASPFAFLLAAATIFLAGCAGPVAGLYPPEPGAPGNQKVLVAARGWHTGLVLPGEALRQRLGPLDGPLAEAPWLEVGWGDEGFYRAEIDTPWIAAWAFLWPTPTVLHVVAAAESPGSWLERGSLLAAVELSPEGFARLADFVADSFQRGRDGAPICLGPGIYGESRFYRAKGNYFALNTCNRWTARALRSAGFPILTPGALLAGIVTWQLRRGGARFLLEEVLLDGPPRPPGMAPAKRRASP